MALALAAAFHAAPALAGGGDKEFVDEDETTSGDDPVLRDCDDQDECDQ